MDKIISFYKPVLEENRTWLKTAVNWFIIAAFVGAFTFLIRPELLNSIVSTFQDRFGANPGLDFNLVLQIFLQNVIASSIGLFGGIAFGLGAFIVIAVNGFLLGYVVSSLLFSNNNLAVSLALIVGGLLPHGIFELSAFLLAGALGLRLGLEWVQTAAAGHRLEVLKKNLSQGLLNFPAIILALFIAALIEVFVSGKIVALF